MVNRPQLGRRLKYFMRLAAIGVAYRRLRIADFGSRKKVARMTTEERSRLESLDTVLRSQNVREQIRPVVERVREEPA